MALKCPAWVAHVALPWDLRQGPGEGRPVCPGRRGHELCVVWQVGRVAAVPSRGDPALPDLCAWQVRGCQGIFRTLASALQVPRPAVTLNWPSLARAATQWVGSRCPVSLAHLDWVAGLALTSLTSRTPLPVRGVAVPFPGEVSHPEGCSCVDPAASVNAQALITHFQPAKPEEPTQGRAPGLAAAGPAGALGPTSGAPVSE